MKSLFIQIYHFLVDRICRYSDSATYVLDSKTTLNFRLVHSSPSYALHEYSVSFSLKNIQHPRVSPVVSRYRAIHYLMLYISQFARRPPISITLILNWIFKKSQSHEAK